MGRPVRWWMRSETKATELRAPIAPPDAARLVAAGHSVTVETAPQRIFPIEEYARAGCLVAEAGSWPEAPPDAVVIGLKEPAARPDLLHHRHVFFGHAYKNQAGARTLLNRFVAAAGTLLDLEYLTDARGRRVAAFGYWAGYAGAALAALHHRGALPVPLRALTRSALDQALRRSADTAVTALVIGALGRCGTGARDALAVAGHAVTAWDLEETRILDRPALLGHDLLVNAVLSTEPGPPFLAPADAADGARRLRVVSDVTCDITSACNRLPMYDRTTTWDTPTRRLHDEPPLDLIAIDNLPSVLPREASEAFSADLLPYLMEFDEAPAWARCRRAFEAACRRNGDTTEEIHA